jgi:hypothetical protein
LESKFPLPQGRGEGGRIHTLADPLGERNQKERKKGENMGEIVSIGN